MARILVVDDEDLIRAMIARALRRDGHAVTVAEDGEDALVKFRPRLYDLVVTDIVMPRKEGIETLRELRQREPDIRIIAMSGGGGADQGFYLKAAVALGADATLQKPFTASALRQLVDDALATPQSAIAHLWYRQFDGGLSDGADRQSPPPPIERTAATDGGQHLQGRKPEDPEASQKIVRIPAPKSRQDGAEKRIGDRVRARHGRQRAEERYYPAESGNGEQDAALPPARRLP